MRQKIIIGTASWGNSYGLLNSRFADQNEVQHILNSARKRNITALDTAPAYGESESLIGSADASDFVIYSKVDASWLSSPDKAYTQLNESLKRLKVRQLSGITFHSADSFLSAPEKASAFIGRIMEEGLASTWGVSVYEPVEAMRIKDLAKPDYFQAPVNLLDRRFVTDAFLGELASAGIRLQARSIFLQGLLLLSYSELPEAFKNLQPQFLQHAKEASRLGVSKLELALLAVALHPSVDTVVVGVNEESQLVEIANALAIRRRKPNLNNVHSSQEIGIIDPRNWST